MESTAISGRVNEGRLVAALGLEQKILADSVLRRIDYAERGSLVSGIILGLLERGAIDEAVKLVYQPGTVAGALFDGDQARFTDDVFRYAQQHQCRNFDDSTIELLAANQQTGLLYRFATELSLNDGTLEMIALALREKWSEPQRRVVYNELGQRALKKGRDQDYWEAIKYFKQSNNQEELCSLQETLLEKPVKNLDLLVKLVDEIYPVEEQRGMLTKVVQKVLQQPESGQEYQLCALWKRRQLSLNQEEIQQLKERLANSLRDPKDLRGSSDLRFSSESQPLFPVYGYFGRGYDEFSELELLWARKNAEKRPARAYFIFLEREYEGPEVLTALRSGLEQALEGKKGYQDSPIDNLKSVREKHLRELLPTAPRKLKAIIAEYLNEDELLRTLSKEYAADNDVKNAYKLWIRGGGDQQEPYVTELRQQLIEQELRGKDPSIFFLERDDGVGQRIVYAQLLERVPKKAYDLAQRLNDEPLLEQARRKIVEQDPDAAIRFFHHYQPEKIDARGMELVAKKLAEKYELPVETVQRYLPGAGSESRAL